MIAEFDQFDTDIDAPVPICLAEVVAGTAPTAGGASKTKASRSLERNRHRNRRRWLRRFLAKKPRNGIGRLKRG